MISDKYEASVNWWRCWRDISERRIGHSLPAVWGRACIQYRANNNSTFDRIEWQWVLITSLTFRNQIFYASFISRLIITVSYIFRIVREANINAPWIQIITGWLLGDLMFSEHHTSIPALFSTFYITITLLDVVQIYIAILVYNTIKSLFVSLKTLVSGKQVMTTI
jgi:hypothetical protein